MAKRVKAFCSSVLLFTIIAFSAFGMGSADRTERLNIENQNLQAKLAECQNQNVQLHEKLDVCSSIAKLVSERRFDEALKLHINETLYNKEVEARKTVVAQYVTLALVSLIGIGLIGMVLFSLIGIILSGSFLESAIRTLSLMAGFVAYFGAKTIGISVPEFMFSSIVLTNPLLHLTLGGIFPLLTGMAVSWYIIRRLRKDDDIAVRVALLLGTFVITVFSDLFATALASQNSDKLLLPNLTFILGVAFYLVFNYKKRPS